MTNARRAALPGSLALVAALALGGCSSDAAPDDSAATPAADTAADAAPEAAGGDGSGAPGEGRGGVSGLVAAVSDAVAQIQDDESQTAVTWDDATVFRRTATAGLDAVTVGACVVAVLPGEDSGDTAATSVMVTEAVDGECSAGLGAPWSGERPDGAGAPGAEGDSGGLSSLDGSGAAADGAPTPPAGELPEMPDGEAPTGRVGGFGSIVAGRVTGVSGTTLTVEVTDADGASTSQTVATSDATVVTTTAVADSSALVVGVCADVQGEADTSGGMAATSITVSDPGDDGCTARGGFGGMPGGQRPGEESADE